MCFVAPRSCSFEFGSIPYSVRFVSSSCPRTSLHVWVVRVLEISFHLFQANREARYMLCPMNQYAIQAAQTVNKRGICATKISGLGIPSTKNTLKNSEARFALQFDLPVSSLSLTTLAWHERELFKVFWHSKQGQETSGSETIEHILLVQC